MQHIMQALVHIVAHDMEDGFACLAPRERNADEDLHHGRGKEAAAADPEQRTDAQRGIEDAANGRAEDAGQHMHLIDQRVAGHDPVLPDQQRDAGEHGRLIGRGDARQRHQRDADQRHLRSDMEHEAEDEDQQCRKEIQSDHNIALVHAVGKHTADQRKHDRRNDGERADNAEHAGGVRQLQNVDRQGEADHGAAEHGDDLPDQHHGKIPSETDPSRLFLFHAPSLPFSPPAPQCAEFAYRIQYYT